LKGAQGINPLRIEIAPPSQDAVMGEGPMSLAQDEQISFFPQRVSGIMAKYAVDGAEDFNDGEAGRDMTVSAFFRDSQNLFPDLLADGLHSISR